MLNYQYLSVDYSINDPNTILIILIARIDYTVC